MNNQLEHLQNSIETLVSRYQAAVREKQALSKKISEMDAAWQKQRHDHRTTINGLQLAYSERMSRMERELTSQIEALQQENAVLPQAIGAKCRGYPRLATTLACARR